MIQIRQYLRDTQPTGKLTDSHNAIHISGDEVLFYTEEALAEGYAQFIDSMIIAHLPEYDQPTIEEFRIYFEETLVDEYVNGEDDSPLH